MDELLHFEGVENATADASEHFIDVSTTEST